MDLGPNLLISSEVFHALRVRDVGHDTVHGEGFGRVPPQGVSLAEIRQPWRGRDRVWVYPPLEYMMAELYFKEMETYVSFFQNTVTLLIMTRPIWTCVCQWI